MFRLVAYHNFKIERESLDFDRSFSFLKSKAEQLDPKDYPQMHLEIECDGETISTFNVVDGKFKENVHDKE